MAPLTTLLVGALLVAATRAVWPSPGCGPDQVAAQSDRQGGADTVHVVVLTSSNKGALMAEMACKFELTRPSVGAHPLDVVIVSEASGASISKIGTSSGDAGQPTVWSPASSSWVSMLRYEHVTWIPPGRAPSIAQSPQVIAMPRPIAEALGWPDRQLRWKDILNLATDPATWNEVAQPGWGTFKLGKTNPRFSTSGLNATVATLQAATESSSDLTLADLRDPKVLRFLRGVESSVVHYAPTSMDFLRNLRAQDDQGYAESYVSAVLLEEKSVWDYNQGNPSGDPATLGQSPPPKTQLVAFYPKEGALMADHPYVTLTADWVSEDQRTGAQGFLAFLEAPPQQERFQALGFRDRNGTPGPEISQDNGLLSATPQTIDLPGGDVLRRIRAGWPKYRKRARVLILIDVSGSMDSRVGTGDPTYLQLAQAAALRAIRRFGPRDEVGLWAFSPGSSTAPYVEEVPIARVSSNAAALRDAIGNLSADGGNRTELYTTIEDAVNVMRTDVDPAKINGIVLLTDGQNEGSTNVDLTGAIAAVATTARERELGGEVRIFTIAYGADADGSTLAAIAGSSQGTAYDATDPTSIRQVFEQVVANF